MSLCPESINDSRGERELREREIEIESGAN
jgi:hypothetical protein